jgi:sugar lactone lactonase YvrE
MRMRRLTLFGVVLGLVSIATIGSASATPDVIVLPGANSAEGIATGAGSSFYAGELLSGDIFRGDLQTGAATRFIDAPAGRQALGLKADLSHDLLFVAGGFTGHGYVYDLSTGSPLADFQLGAIINDVVLTKDAAWFTDSALPHLYRVPIGPRGALGNPSILIVDGPAGDTSFGFNLNGIAATPDGKTLIVAHSGLGALFSVDPQSGDSARIDGVDVPFVDGILFEAGRLYAVQNVLNRIAEIQLTPDLSSGTLDGLITSQGFQVPTTVARYGDRLAAVNAKFDTGFPPSADTFEVVIVNR